MRIDDKTPVKTITKPYESRQAAGKAFQTEEAQTMSDQRSLGILEAYRVDTYGDERDDYDTSICALYGVESKLTLVSYAIEKAADVLGNISNMSSDEQRAMSALFAARDELDGLSRTTLEALNVLADFSPRSNDIKEALKEAE